MPGTDDNQDFIITEAAATAPTPGATAAAEDADNEAQEGQEDGSDEPKEPKTFTQEEVDRIAQQAREKGERKARRELEAKALEAQRPANGPPPTREQYAAGEAGDKAYWDAAVDYAADQKSIQREQAKQQTQVVDAYETRADEARGRFADFDTVAYNEDLKVSDLMADTIRDSDLGPDLLYHLGKNPQESARIASLPALHQVKELAKLEVKLAANPPVKKVSSAPEPIKPLPGAAPATPKYGPDDPRSDKLPTDDWMAARRKQMSNR